MPEEMEAARSGELLTKEEWEPLLRDESKLSPMMQQYLNVKHQYDGYIVFFRLGDFYEMFFDDALTVSRELELTLTGKNCGLPGRAPMCGIPHVSSDTYVQKLVEKGYKVAICEQVESPYLAKGVVKREVIRITTPGTVIESTMLPEDENNYIGSVYLPAEGMSAGVCFADISTGEMQFAELNSKEIVCTLIDELSRFSPRELLVSPACSANEELQAFIRGRLECVQNFVAEEDYQDETLEQLVVQQFQPESLEKLEPEGRKLALRAVGSLLSYLIQTQKNGIQRLTGLTCYTEEKYLALDLTARRNLELTETMRSREKRGSLLWVLDHTKTAMGKRLMRKYLEQPLLNVVHIGRRQAAVAELFNKTVERGDLIDGLSGVYDLQRLMTKVVYGTVGPRDLLALATAAGHLPQIKAVTRTLEAARLRELDENLDVLDDVRELIEKAINPDCPPTMKDGGVIRKGYSSELDELTDLQVNARDYLLELEEREKEATGIKTLKVGYNRVFGYYIEVSKSFISQVPAEWVRKQTLVGGERYINQELKDLENRMLYATEKVLALEAEMYEDVRKRVQQRLPVIEKTAAAVAELDVLASLADVAVQNRYVRPEVTISGKIHIIGGRHPVVEKLSAESGLAGKKENTSFIPNDTLLDGASNRIAIITGPNMAGKSTYMRQVALITIMAQIGSFVPAQSAEISVCDRIFTRVGASDDLTAGQSTFMVEMSEVATILKNATPRSLVLLDEIGRGTSTFDGMSIARAVVEYILNEKGLGCKTMFATHYHELTDLENQFPGIVNYNIAVRRRGDDIIFLRKIVRGGTDDSYGIEVAHLAGVPQKVIRRAKVILKQLEDSAAAAREVAKEQGGQLEQNEQLQVSMTQQQEEKALRMLRQSDLDSMTPRDALDFLYELKKMMI